MFALARLILRIHWVHSALQTKLRILLPFLLDRALGIFVSTIRTLRVIRLVPEAEDAHLELKTLAPIVQSGNFIQ